MQQLLTQQAANPGLLQRTIVNMQNTLKTYAIQQAQLCSSVSSQLDNITKILNGHFARIDEDLKKFLYNQNFIYNTMETHHQNSERWVASIKAQLVRLGMQPQAPIV